MPKFRVHCKLIVSNPRDIRKIKPKTYATPTCNNPEQDPVSLFNIKNIVKRDENTNQNDSSFFIDINTSVYSGNMLTFKKTLSKITLL